MSRHEQDHQEGTMGQALSVPPQELLDLLSDRALFGLEDDEATRLDQLLAEHPWVREDYIDEAVAGMDVAFGATESMPADLANDVASRLTAEVEVETGPIARIGTGSGSTTTGNVGWFGWAGWIAAAAAVTFAATLWQPPVPAIRNSAQLVSWAERHPDAVRWDWAPGLVDPAEGVTGYVTFSPEAQEGYMMIKGLAPNDPRVEQYQLWIWDREREPDPENPQPLAPEVHPVDGGVFDVNDEGEVVIPMKLPLRVGQPYLFAVTVERPGGVVKSDKSSVPLIAGPPSA